MADIRLTITGPTGVMEELDQFFRKSGVLTESGLVSSYEGVAVTVFGLHAVGSLDVLAQCIAAYGNANKPSLKASYFIPGKGPQILKDFPFKAVAEVLRKTQELHIERDNPGA